MPALSCGGNRRFYEFNAREAEQVDPEWILTSAPDGRIWLYVSNGNHPLFDDLKSLVKIYTGNDQLVGKMLLKLGTVGIAFITGD